MPEDNTTNPPGLMDFETWKAAAKKEAGKDWMPEGAEDQYEAYVYNAKHGTSYGGGAGTHEQIARGETTSFNDRGEDSTGMRARARELGFSEDFSRFDEGTLNMWEKYKDDRCPDGIPYAAMDGSGCVEKPIDGNEDATSASYLGVQPNAPGTSHGGQAGGQGGKPTEPYKPTTYTEGDKALSYTGNPLVDNMINMFNQAQSQRAAVGGGTDVDRADLGAFARGENQQVGGGDDLSKLSGMLMGTGNNAFLWSAVDDDAFGGMKGQWKGEAAKSAKPPTVAAIANPSPPPVEQTAEQVVATPDGKATYDKQKLEQDKAGYDPLVAPDSPIAQMMGGQFGTTGFGNRYR